MATPRRYIFSGKIPVRILPGLVCCLLSAFLAHSQTQDSVLAPAAGYTFLAGGHWYGAHENVHSLRCASSLYAALPAIHAAHPDRVFALGDVVRDASDVQQIQGFLDLRRQIGVPVHLAAGNHDLLPDGSLPTALGPNHQYFLDHGDRFLVLNTEGLARKQVRRLLNYVQDSLAGMPQGRNLFVFTHRLYWALAEPGMSEMDDFANEPLGDIAQLDSIKLLHDAISRLAPPGRVWWFSGDLGASWSLTLFEGESREGQRHFYAAGLGDRAEDAFWRVEVDSLGAVQVRPFPLVDAQALGSEHGLDHWRRKMKEVMAENKAPGGLSIRGILTSRSLWIGLVLGAVLGAIGVAALRRRRR